MNRADITALVRDEFPDVADRMEREPEGRFCYRYPGQGWFAVRWAQKSSEFQIGFSDKKPAWVQECFDCSDPATECHMNCGPVMENLNEQ